MGKSGWGQEIEAGHCYSHTRTTLKVLGLMSDGQWVHSVSIMQEQRLSIYLGRMEGHLEGQLKGPDFQKGRDFLLMCFPTSWSKLDVAGTPRLPRSSSEDISQGCGEEPRHWLGKARVSRWSSPFGASSGSRGGKTPALAVVATVGVVAGLFLKPGLCALHGSTGGWIGRKMGIG